MGRGKAISSEKIPQIIVLREEGYTEAAVGQRLNVSQQGVHSCLLGIKKGPLSSKPRTGRPRVTSAATDRMIHRLCVAKPTISSNEIQSLLPQTVSPSTRTIRRRLQVDFKLRSYRPALKPKLSTANRKDRLKFARIYKHWTKEQWCKVLFTDEAMMRQFRTEYQRVRRPPGTRFMARYVSPTVKKSPSVMVWGGISEAGVGPLCFIPPNNSVTAATYLSTLQKYLVSSMAQSQCSVFQHDGAPAHRAHIVRHWLHEENLTVLYPSPGNSPDLNPIEHCWSYLKRRVAQKKPSSTQDLQNKVLHVWNNEISVAYCRKLAESMPSRLKAIFKSHGGPTRF